MTQVSVLIPAYNEGKRIGQTVKSLKSAGFQGQIIVVDDGSKDDTAKIAAESGAKVFQLLVNKGKGEAIMAAFSYLTGDIVLLLDADLQGSASEALILLEPIRASKADMTVARFSKERSGQGFGLAKNTAVMGIKLITGEDIVAPLSGQRCMRKEVLATLMPLAPRFGLEVGMTVDALRKGYRIYEIETGLKHCPPGRDWQGFLHRGAQFWDICLALGKRAWGGAR
ncbi:MAG: glycosyl transferase [Firmicutes bacterium HGW-Firmicutes-12]|jgi:glycosyltransferase involved in cell wall biosynthesis|nr:MAG: glycosyl transferase [Firmicutes bacterium HGW-Firmicutes-12]